MFICDIAIFTLSRAALFYFYPSPKVFQATITGKTDYVAPVILGAVLGPIAEENLRQAMIISGNDPSALVSSPLSAILIGLSILSLLSPQLRALWGKMRKRATKK